MDQKEINIKFFQKLIERYLEGKATSEELKLLINYYESFQKENNWVEELGPENSIKEKMLFNILDTIKEQDKPTTPRVIKLVQSPIFKVAAAASLLLFIAYIFTPNSFNTNGTETNVPVVESTISTGTHKAILTREDGSTVTLTKGTNYKSSNISSNGEQLVYNESSPPKDTPGYNYLTIPRGGQFVLLLEDNTKVWLNSETKIKYPLAFVPGEPRVIDLIYGEAYFEVSPSSDHNGATFIVNNDNHKIEVLGTAFNVKAYPDDINVITTLVHGKVGINYQNENYLLLPNQQAVLNRSNNRITFKEVDVFYETSWKDGRFSFNNKSLKEIMTVLSRWYDFEVVFKNKSIENEKFVGVLGKNEKIESILNNLKSLEVINDFQFNKNKLIIE